MKTKELVSKLKRDIAKAAGYPEADVSIRIYENSSGNTYQLDEFFSQYNPEELQKGQCNLVFRTDTQGDALASFKLRDMYDCCGVLVASDLHVVSSKRNKGIGSLLVDFMSEFARHYGYGVLQATNRADGEHQRRIFEKLNWANVNTFKNFKTGNVIDVWLLKLS